jgi:hypothetical protein
MIGPMAVAIENQREAAGPTDLASPLPTSPIPTRPLLTKADVFNLIRLVIEYRWSWEIHIDPDGIWVAQGRTVWNCEQRFEADTAVHLEERIKVI